MAPQNEREVFAKTVYAEARGEPEEGQRWVAWVIKNRAGMGERRFGGNSIEGVCKHPAQFECWNGKNDIDVSGEPQVYNRIRQLTDAVYDAPHDKDPTGGADHYNNPDKEGHKAWTENCRKLRKIGNHQFYIENR